MSLGLSSSRAVRSYDGLFLRWSLVMGLMPFENLAGSGDLVLRLLMDLCAAGRSHGRIDGWR